MGGGEGMLSPRGKKCLVRAIKCLFMRNMAPLSPTH